MSKRSPRIDSQVGIDDPFEANLFLRRLWAILRKEFPNYGWQYTPHKVRGQQRIEFGFLDLGDGTPFEVSVTYLAKGSIDTIRFERDPLNKTVSECLRQAVQQAVPPRPMDLFTSSVGLQGLGRPCNAYEGRRFRLLPRSDDTTELTIIVQGYDLVDAKAQVAALQNVAVNILSATARHPFWLTEPAPKLTVNGRINEHLLELSGEPDQSIYVEDRIAFFPAALELLDAALTFPIETGLEPLLRACDHFRTARLFQAQVEDLLRLGPIEKDADGRFQIRVTPREELQAASKFGVRQQEITMTLYMSVLEVISAAANQDVRRCENCGQLIYSIKKRVRDVFESHLGDNAWRMFQHDPYDIRSKYLHAGSPASRGDYAGHSIPQLDPGDPTGCRTYGTIALHTLQELTWCCLTQEINAWATARRVSG